MRLSGRLSAAIEILKEFESRRAPLKTAIADWSRVNRYAGAKDRAWISGLCLDVLRKRASLAAAMDDPSPRAVALAALRFMWRTPLGEIAEAAAEEPHGPGALAENEAERLRAGGLSADAADDAPAWIAASLQRAFGDGWRDELAGLCARADVDLRVNTLKTTPEKAFAALKSVKAAPVDGAPAAMRIPAPDPSERAPAVTVIPAFNKGWVEVQDLGSQIAAAAAGEIVGAQVLDFCAGGGGKTLALAAMMQNTGQLYAFDIDARRLKPLFHRAKRAGVRNLQIRSPAGGDGLDDLAGKMDVVFVDAPCTGSGTWRRHPDAKWRLTEKQLAKRMEEQDAALDAAAQFVKPGGRLIYVTCSVLMEENDDRLDAFLKRHSAFAPGAVIDAIANGGVDRETAQTKIARSAYGDAAIQMTPNRSQTDGFFVATLVCGRSH
ncbi:MAG: RsmB/NOP family class I SAM-dependent RNA methyltransferase [Pseudomonadota bacterium]